MPSGKSTVARSGTKFAMSLLCLRTQAAMLRPTEMHSCLGSLTRSMFCTGPWFTKPMMIQMQATTLRSGTAAAWDSPQMNASLSHWPAQSTKAKRDSKAQNTTVAGSSKLLTPPIPNTTSPYSETALKRSPPQFLPPQQCLPYSELVWWSKVLWLEVQSIKEYVKT